VRLKLAINFSESNYASADKPFKGSCLAARAVTKCENYWVAKAFLTADLNFVFFSGDVVVYGISTLISCYIDIFIMSRLPPISSKLAEFKGSC
jgi:hypothetical protein